VETQQKPASIIYTTGHSNRPLEEFIEILQAHGVSLVVDVRTVRRSQHNPQFNGDTLAQALKAAGIDYVPLPGLGGFRHPQPNSVNTGWRNPSFRGYADYMQTKEFEDSLLRVIDLAKHHRVALMCAEAVPWRCHRSLIADALLARGIQVEDIYTKASPRAHHLTPWAKISNTHVTYPLREPEESHLADQGHSSDRLAG